MTTIEKKHPILNQIYYISEDKQGKQIILCEVPVPHTDYYLTIRRTRNSEWQREWKNDTSKLHYIKPCIEEWESAHNSCGQYEVKLSRMRIGYTRVTQGHFISRNNQQPTCMWKTEPSSKTLPARLSQLRDSRKKNNIQGDIRTLM